MNGFNKVILAGNLTRDPELRYMPSGTAIATFGIAVGRKWKDSQTNEMKEEVMFVDVDAFGKQAETVGQYLKKGRPVLIEGRLRLQQWEDKQTQQKRSKHTVTIETFTFLDSGGSREGGAESAGGSGGGGGYARPARPPAAAAPPASSSAPEVIPPDEDDVPF